MSETTVPITVLLRPMSTAPEGPEAMEPDEINIHEGAWAIIYGTNAKPVGWIDTHTLAHLFYRDRLLPSPNTQTRSE